jgi:hypothetical protein
MSTSGPLGGDVGESESADDQRLEMLMVGPLGVMPENAGAPTISA